MTAIEVTFLGTTAAIPTRYRNHPAIHIKYNSKEEHCFLFDCGEGTQRQMLLAGINFMRIDKIFITHWHADHFAGLFGLMETMNLEGRKNKLQIFAPEAEDFVGNLLSLGYASKGFEVAAKNVWHEGSSAEMLVNDTEYEILSVPVKHGIPAVGYAFHEKDRIKIDKSKLKDLGLPPKGPIYKKLKENGSAIFKGRKIILEDISFGEKGKKIVYSGDTMPCENIARLAAGADLLIHDSTYFDDSLSSKHAALKDVMKVAERADVKKVILTHISRRYADIEDLKERVKDMKNVSIAKDFMKIVL